MKKHTNYSEEIELIHILYSQCKDKETQTNVSKIEKTVKCYYS